jgi:hypothetical protein
MPLENPFIPTHIISLRGTRYVVALDGDHGPAYTQMEWLACRKADFERQEDGTWTLRGNIVPTDAVQTLAEYLAALEAPTLYACEQNLPGIGWTKVEATHTWADWKAIAAKKILGGGRTWRLRRPDGSAAWEGTCAQMPDTDPTLA